jgi:hypothetical protein
MREHWQRLIEASDKLTDSFLAMQLREPGSPDDGAVFASWGGPGGFYADPKPSLGLAASALASYLCAESRHAHDPAVPEAIGRALDYATRVQNADGTFDYRPCNFDSAPDTAFIVNRAVVSLALMEKAAGDPLIAPLAVKLRAIIVAAGEGIRTRGFHTPNHRWAIAAALSSCCRLTGDARYKERAQEYLREGLDCNADGEWSERSAGGYNIVNDEQMMALAAERNDDSFLDSVERNLRMMLAYVDPDGSVFTNNSTRQDRGKKTWLDSYWYLYFYMAKRRGNRLFTAVARRIMEDIVAAGRDAPDCLDRVMLEFGGVDYGNTDEPIPTSYAKFFRDSGLVRLRRGGFSLSLIKGVGRFLYFQSGSVSAYLKLGVSYFDKREFKADSIEEEDGAYVLRFLAKGWYYLPFETKSPTSDWWKMDNASRPKQWGPDLSFALRVDELPEGDGVELRALAMGCEGVPVRFEIGLCTGTGAELRVGTEHFEVEGRPGEAVLARSGKLCAWSGLDALEIGPAFAEHRDMGGTYGSESRSRDHFTAYFTAFSPFSKAIRFRRVPTPTRIQTS